MRPAPIIWFERIILLSFVLGLLDVALNWRQFVRPGPFAMEMFFVAQAIYFGTYALLVQLISRRGNPVARWTFTFLVVAATLLFFLALPPPPGRPATQTWLAAAQCLLSLFSLIFIFGPDTRPWFRSGAVPIDPEVFR